MTGLKSAKVQQWQPAHFNWISPFFYETPFMMMAFYMLCACVVLQIALSYLLPKLPHEDLQRLYWANPLEALKSAGWPGLGDYRIASGLVVLMMTILYIIFR